MPRRGANTILEYSIIAYSVILCPCISYNLNARIFSCYGNI